MHLQACNFEPPKFLKVSDLNVDAEFNIELCLMKVSVVAHNELEINVLLSILLLW
jgi:hypothetical protein